MTGPIHGAVHAQLDGMAADSGALQGIADEQAALMSNLGSTLEGLASTLQSPAAGVAVQQLGADMHQEGLMFATQFTNHSSMMSQNAQIINASDEDNAHMF